MDESRWCVGGRMGETKDGRLDGRGYGRKQGRANTTHGATKHLPQQFHVDVAPTSPLINMADVENGDYMKGVFEDIRTVAMGWRAKLDGSESRRMLGVVIDTVERQYMVQTAPLWNK